MNPNGQNSAARANPARQSGETSEPGEIPENNSVPSTTVDANQQSSTSNEEELTDSQIGRRQRLESFIEDFREGKRTRSESFAAILGELNRGPELNSEEKETTFKLYSTEIDSAEARAHRQLALAGSRSETFAPKSNQRLPRHSDEESGSELDDDDQPRKKRRLHETDMPWFRQDGENALRSNPISEKTVDLLRIFNKDIKKCKFLVSIAPGAPDNIPPSQWERIFKGETIDLDQILSSLYRVTLAEERKARIGETEVSLGPIEATRKVSSSSDWSVAWRRAARGIAFAFPHRTRELEDYAAYIENEFAAKSSASHHRIIHYDVAVRNLVRGGQQVLLTDTQHFISLYSAIVLPDGIQYSGSQRNQARKKSEICNRFNDKGCKAQNCRYRHACKTCGSTAHGKAACTTSGN
jgi:hypothetical protein